LNENDFKNTKLNDIIFVNDTAFNILEISDFDATIKRPTKNEINYGLMRKFSYGNYSQIPNVITIGDNPIGVPGGEPIGGGSGFKPQYLNHLQYFNFKHTFFSISCSFLEGLRFKVLLQLGLGQETS